MQTDPIGSIGRNIGQADGLIDFCLGCHRQDRQDRRVNAAAWQRNPSGRSHSRPWSGTASSSSEDRQERPGRIPSLSSTCGRRRPIGTPPSGRPSNAATASKCPILRIRPNRGRQMATLTTLTRTSPSRTVASTPPGRIDFKIQLFLTANHFKIQSFFINKLF